MYARTWKWSWTWIVERVIYNFEYFRSIGNTGIMTFCSKRVVKEVLHVIRAVFRNRIRFADFYLVSQHFIRVILLQKQLEDLLHKLSDAKRHKPRIIV